MTPGTTFDAWVWVAALKGQHPDAAALHRLRFAPPRLRTRAVVDAEVAGVSWDLTHDIAVALIAEKSAVTEGTVVRRCHSWGIPVHTRVVQLGARWPRRQKVLTESAARAYFARALRPIRAPAGSRRRTSPGS